jgi:glycosyltransferase involved in cell wall biosynthesis
VKVLMTADTVGGVFTYACDLARALRTEGVQVVLATMGRELEPDQFAQLPVRAHESAFRLEWMDDPWDDVATAGDWLLELERAERPDVVHVNGYAHAALPFRAPVLVAAHSCVTSWWLAVHGAEAPPEWDRYRAAVRAGLDAARIVVAPTAAMLRDLERCHGPLGARGRVVHNGSAAPRGTRKEPFVLGAGRMWDPAKNLAALDAAAEGLPWPVLVAGDCDGATPAHAQALGRLSAPELARCRGRAAIFAHPARYEPFGLAPLEAARAGCALVLGDIPSLRELWADAAVYVRDAGELREALRALIADPAARSALASAAQARAARYSLPTMASAYRPLYLETATAPLGRAA